MPSDESASEQDNSREASSEPSGQAEPSWQEPARHGKRSPYENAPYVMNQGYERQEYRYEPQPRPPKAPKEPKKRQGKGGFWRGALAVCLVAAMVAGGCLITAHSVNNTWRKNTENNTIPQIMQSAPVQRTGADFCGQKEGRDLHPGPPVMLLKRFGRMPDYSRRATL